MRPYLFVLEIEPVRAGERYLHLPLHCTLMPWFYFAACSQDLLRYTRGVFEKKRAIELTSDGCALFGGGYDIPVHTIIATADLPSLHMDLFRTLNKLGVVYKYENYIGPKYQPHVTIKGRRSFPTGSRQVADCVYLVEGLNIGGSFVKEIITRIKLGQ